MPYREEEVLVAYPLKSSRLFVVVLCFVGALALVGTGIALTVVFAGGPLRIVLLSLIPVAVFLAYAFSAAGHRVAGGTGELRLYQGRIEVPRPYSRQPLVFPMDDTSVLVHTFRGRIAMQDVSEVRVLRLRAGSAKRDLSSRVFTCIEELDRAAADIVRIKGGLGPTPDSDGSPDGRRDGFADAGAEAGRDSYDDHLDRELAGIE